MADGSILHSLVVTLADADSVPDAELLRRYAEAADAVAFELLVRRHAELVWSVCRAVHPTDHETAEDAFQATFLTLARKAAAVRDPSAAGWLFRVARNAAVRAKRYRSTPLPSDVSAAAPPDRAESAEVARVVSEEVGRLAAKFREPVLLCFYEGYSHAQAAERLGWAVGTVASRLSRAKDRLRDRLTRRGVALPAVGAGVLAGGSAPAAAIRSAVSGATGATTDTVRTLSTEVLRSMTMQKLKLTAAACAAVLLLGGVGTVLAWPARSDDKSVDVKGAKAKPADPDLAKLQGKWKPIKIVSNELGEAPPAVVNDMAWEFVGNKFRGKDPGQEMKEVGKFTIDSSKSPKHITMSGFDPGKGKEVEMLGIYELKGDTLTVCLSDDGTRPTEFAAKKGGATGLLVLKKVEPKADDKKPDPAKAKPEDDQKAFQGEWKPVKIATKDGEAPAAELKGMKWEIEGDKMFVTDKPGEDRKEEVSFTLDPAKSPKHIDMTALTGPAQVKGKVMPGIYELKDGKLTICFRPAEIADEGRPTEFKGGKGERAAVIVLEKVGKK